MKVDIRVIITVKGRKVVPFIKGWGFVPIRKSKHEQIKVVRFDDIKASVHISTYLDNIYLEINDRYLQPYSSIERVFYELVELWYNDSKFIHNSHFIEGFGVVSESEASRILYNEIYKANYKDWAHSLTLLEYIEKEGFKDFIHDVRLTAGSDKLGELTKLDYQSKVEL